MEGTRFKHGKFYLGDCLEVMKEIPDNSIDMILCDLPYGTTACKWDTIIPFEPLWEQYERCIKDDASIVLSASQPFTSKLISSKYDLFRYLWLWVKSKPSNFMNAKLMPLLCVEDICVFSHATCNNMSKLKMRYNPQGTTQINKKRKNGISVGGKLGVARHAVYEKGKEYLQEATNYPKQILEFQGENNTFHPTQKPVALFEYLIKTYTNEGMMILDNCAGSGTTAIACENTNRNWICIEKEQEYFDKAVERIQKHIGELNGRFLFT